MIMAKKERFPDGYSSGFNPHNAESEGSGSSGRVDEEVTASENSSVPQKKWIDLSSATRDGFDVPIQVLHVSKLSRSERKNLALRLEGELDQIRIFQKRLSLQRNQVAAISSSSAVLSSGNVQAGMHVMNARKSTGLGSAPGKSINPSSQKARGWNRGVTGRFASANESSVTPTFNVVLMKQCESLLKKLMTHQYGWVFNTPVDVVKLKIPDYFTVIKHPMDLGTVKRKITSCSYLSPLDFVSDVRLTFSNAMTYNPPANDVHFMADTLRKFFELRWKVIEKKLPGKNSQPPEVHDEMDLVKPMSPLKKRKVDSTPIEVPPEPAKPVLTDEEKHNLRRDLESSLEDLPENIIEFLREQSSHGMEEEEIEIDINDLGDKALLKLRKLLDDHLQEKQNRSRAEPCEIELLNESGISNSTMQLYKGIDLVEEDVDIGENEPPVSSYPPVKIEKDEGRLGNKHSPGSSSDSDSSSSSDDESDAPKASSPVNLLKENAVDGPVLEGKEGVDDFVDGNQSVSGLDQLEQISQPKPSSAESDSRQDDGDSAPTERQLSPEKLYRAAVLKNRFADIILKAREKTLTQGEKGDPEKLRLEKEELENQRRKEKARLQAEAKAAEDARRRAEEEAAAEARKRIELERKAARQALLKMEKTVEINETSRFLKDLEMLRTVGPEQLPLPTSLDVTSPEPQLEDGLGSFNFGGSNPLEKLGLYMKMDEIEEDEEGGEHEPPSCSAPEEAVNDVEEGEID